MVALAAILSAFTFVVTRIEETLYWVDEEAMEGLVHVVGRIDQGDGLFTQIGFFIENEDKEAFEEAMEEKTEIAATDTPLRVMAYRFGGNNRSPKIVQNNNMTLELLWDGYDPLAGKDWFVDKPTNRNRQQLDTYLDKPKKKPITIKSLGWKNTEPDYKLLSV